MFSMFQPMETEPSNERVNYESCEEEDIGEVPETFPGQEVVPQVIKK